MKPSYRQEPVATTGFTLKEFIVLLVIIGALVALILPAILAAREAASAATCHGRMFQLKQGVELFRDTNGRFPPAVFLDEASKTEHSWRVLILPYFTNDSLDDYRWNEAWNSKHNSSVFPHSDSEHFQCPSGADVDRTEFTNYFCVRGDETMFPNGKALKLDDVTDGAENTIVLVEAHGFDIYWREPRDLEYGTMSFELNEKSVPSINSPHVRGPGATFADNKFYRLSGVISEADLRALLTRAGGDSPKRNEIEKDNSSLGR